MDGELTDVKNVQTTLNKMFKRLNELEISVKDQKGGVIQNIPFKSSISTPSISTPSISTPSIPKPSISTPSIPKPSISETPKPEMLNSSKIIGDAKNKFTHIFLKGALFIAVVVMIIIVVRGSSSLANFIGESNDKLQTHWLTKFLKHPVDSTITLFKNMFNIFMVPFVEFFENIMHVLTDLVKSIQNIRLMINYMRTSIRTFLLDIAGMFYGYAKKLSFLFERLMTSFKLIFRIFEDIYYGLLYTMDTLYDIKNTFEPLAPLVDPVVGIVNFFCFHEATLIDIIDGTIPISKIKIGDQIKEGGKVIGIHKFSGKDIDMYLYNNSIIVSGCHLVLEDDEWIRVKDSKLAYILKTKETDIYCLSTEKGLISTHGTTFADYMEVKDIKHIQHIFKLVMEHLNKHSSNEKILIKERVWGFTENTLVKTINGPIKISNIQIGDHLENGNTINIVLGVTKVDGRNIQLYEYNNVLSSGNNIIKTNNKWELIKDIGKPVSHKEEFLYHVFTNNGQITVNNVNNVTIFRDYQQTKDKKTNQKIDKFVELTLN